MIWAPLALCRVPSVCSASQIASRALLPAYTMVDNATASRMRIMVGTYVNAFSCSVTNCNVPVPAAALCAVPPPPPTAVCPATSNASNCLIGLSGPAGAIAFLAASSNSGGIVTSPPVSIPLPVSAQYLCSSYISPCDALVAYGATTTAANGSTVALTAEQCPPGQAVTTYMPVPVETCIYLVASLAQLPELYSLVICGESNCTAPANVPRPPPPRPPPSPPSPPPSPPSSGTAAAALSAAAPAWYALFLAAAAALRAA